MNTIFSRTCAALASALITVAVGAGIDALAVIHGQAAAQVATAPPAHTPS